MAAIVHWSGREIRALRQAQRMSLRAFSEHLGVSERMVSKWEAGGRAITPRPVNQAALDTSLAASAADVHERFTVLLASATGTPGEEEQRETGEQDPGATDGCRSTLEVQDQGEEEEMKRRSLMRGAVVAGVAAPAVAALVAARQELDAVLSDESTADIAYWESVAERYAYGYNGRAPAGILAEIAVDLGQLRPVLSHARTVAARSRLCHVVSRLAGVAGIVLHDLGDHRESTQWFHAAGRAAEESGDGDLQVWVRARGAMVPLNFGAPALAGSLVEPVLALGTRHTSAARVLGCAVAARAYAATGDRESALTAVNEAESAVERLGVGDRADSWFGYPPQKHHVHLSQALTLLGETRRAYAQQDRALELSRSPSVMTRGLIAFDRASCLAQDGETEEAVSVAADAFEALPPSYRDGLTHARATAVLRLVSRTPESDRLRTALDSAVG